MSSQKPKRMLVHVPMLHDMPAKYTGVDEEVRNKYQLDLGRNFDELTAKIETIHSELPFDKVYLESVSNASVELSREVVANGPAIYLQSNGAQLMPTEHQASSLLEVELFSSEQRTNTMFDMLDKLKRLKVEEVLDQLFDGAQNYDGQDRSELKELFSDFFQGLEYADVLKARERWIVYNIATSLKEGEVGILFLGMQHDIEQQVYTAMPDTRYEKMRWFKGMLPKDE